MTLNQLATLKEQLRKFASIAEPIVKALPESNPGRLLEDWRYDMTRANNFRCQAEEFEERAVEQLAERIAKDWTMKEWREACRSYRIHAE